MTIQTWFLCFTCFQLLQELAITNFTNMNCDEDMYLLQTDELPLEKRFRPSVANGYFGTIVYDSIFHLNGFYNGNDTNSTFAKIPNPIAFALSISDPNVTRNYTLDMFNGLFMETITGCGCKVTLTLYAHQKYKSIMCAEIEATRSWSESAKEIVIDIQSLTLPIDKIDDMKILDHKKVNDTFTYFKVTSLIPEREDFPPPIVTIVSTTVPKFLSLSATENTKKWSLLFSATVNDDQLALHNVEEALNLWKNGTLLEHHTTAWNKLWLDGGQIEVMGNCKLAKIMNSAFYYIVSSMPMGSDLEYVRSVNNWPFFGVCPTSLAQMDTENETYWGHIFWDQETWILPPIQLFYPDVIKRILIQSRFRNLNSAKGKAASLGYDGAMFPWESAYTGYDTSPWLPAVLREIHITGDIALAMQQYFYFTQYYLDIIENLNTNYCGDFNFSDISFLLKEGGYGVFCEIAKFWKSRLSYQKEYDAYGIIDAMGPDEHHDNVNNSAYLNVIAQISLNFPQELYDILNSKEENFTVCCLPEPSWKDIAENIYVPFDKVLNFHPEFDGYNTSEEIKQADIVLLGYPLLYNMPKDVRRNDLEFYEKVTSAKGPAMTWGMHAIGWLEVEEPERAKLLFEKSFAYIRSPFNIWTENAEGFAGAINFITGMGGFLQSVLHGYFGIRVHADRFEFKPYPLPNTTAYSVKKMKYLGNIFSSTVRENKFSLTVNYLNPAYTCCLQCYNTGYCVPFESYSNLPLAKYAIICKKNK